MENVGATLRDEWKFYRDIAWSHDMTAEDYELWLEHQLRDLRKEYFESEDFRAAMKLAVAEEELEKWLEVGELPPMFAESTTQLLKLIKERF